MLGTPSKFLISTMFSLAIILFYFKQVENEAFYDSESNTVVVPFDSCATGFGYLWNETPVLGTEALAIYSANEFQLPAAPWKIEVEMTRCQCYKTFYGHNLQIFIIS